MQIEKTQTHRPTPHTARRYAPSATCTTHNQGTLSQQACAHRNMSSKRAETCAVPHKICRVGSIRSVQGCLPMQRSHRRQRSSACAQDKKMHESLRSQYPHICPRVNHVHTPMFTPPPKQTHTFLCLPPARSSPCASVRGAGRSGGRQRRNGAASPFVFTGVFALLGWVDRLHST